MLSKNEKPLETRTDLHHSEKRMYRVLARVNSLDVDKGLAGLVIPAWKNEEVLNFEWSAFPVDLMSRFKQDYRFHTYANIGAPKKVSDFYIDIERYELS